MNDKYLLELKNISKSYAGLAGARRKVLEDINFSIPYAGGKGSFISVLASFGSGKSTLLKIISGLVRPDSGTVIFTGKNYVEPEGKIVYIPEKPSSFPWMNVQENIKIVQKGRNDEHFVEEIINVVGLTGYEFHHPNDNSLGFRFRISLARALSVKPAIILLDDTFKRISAQTRDELYEVLRNIINKLGITFILATTNISEAVYLSSQILLMKKNPGKIFDDIKLNAETMEKRGLNRQERFISLRNEIEAGFASVGENLQTEIHL